MNSWSTIGFDSQKEQLTNTMKNGVLSHAYMFTGPEQIGKKLFALELFTNLQKRPVKNDADLILVACDGEKSAETIGISSIRSLRAFFSLKPRIGPYKCALIDEADKMTEDSQNALLKILEEPPAHSILVLVSAHPDRLLPTIRSRCERVPFQSHNTKMVEQALGKNNLPKSDMELLLLLADGRIGWALDVLHEKEIGRVKKAVSGFQNVLKHGSAERLIYAKKIIDEGAASWHTDIWLRWIRSHGKRTKRTREVLHELLKLHELLRQPKYNHRLLLENFLVNA